MFVQEKQGARCVSVRIIRITCMNLRTEEVLKSYRCRTVWFLPVGSLCHMDYARLPYT